MIHNVISVFAEENCVGTALFGEVCDACNGGGINFVLMYTVEAMIIGIGILAVIGLMVFGIQYLTASNTTTSTTAPITSPSPPLPTSRAMCSMKRRVL